MSTAAINVPPLSIRTLGVKLSNSKAIFSRKWYTSSEWYYRWNSVERKTTHQRLDSLRERLDSLCNRLGGLDYHEDIQTIIGRICWVEEHIGVWLVHSNGTSPLAPCKVECIYPPPSLGRKRTLSHWFENIMGEEKKMGVCLVMLSDDAVCWLNELNRNIEVIYGC